MPQHYLLDEHEELRRARYAVRSDLRRKQFLGLPIARCDPDTHQVFTELKGGTITFREQSGDFICQDSAEPTIQRPVPCPEAPEIMVFAGPNGSGKTTINRLLRPAAMPYINADEIQATTFWTNLAAAQFAESLREACLNRQESFCFETVLSTERNLILLRRAKEAGFFIRGWFVLTCTPALNALRVASRVADGGHDVPLEKIETRYHRSLGLLPEFLRVCDVCSVFDNSGPLPFRLFRKRETASVCDGSGRFWSADEIRKLTGVSDALSEDLNLPAVAG